MVVHAPHGIDTEVDEDRAETEEFEEVVVHSEASEELKLLGKSEVRH